MGADIESITPVYKHHNKRNSRKKLKEEEWHWQNNLKTLRQYRGLYIREES